MRRILATGPDDRGSGRVAGTIGERDHPSLEPETGQSLIGWPVPGPGILATTTLAGADEPLSRLRGHAARRPVESRVYEYSNSQKLIVEYSSNTADNIRNDRR